MLKVSNNHTRAQINEKMDTISTSFIHPYGTTGPVFSSATPPGTLGTTRKRQVENEGIEPATATCVLTTKPFTHILY